MLTHLAIWATDMSVTVSFMQIQDKYNIKCTYGKHFPKWVEHTEILQHIPSLSILFRGYTDLIGTE